MWNSYPCITELSGWRELGSDKLDNLLEDCIMLLVITPEGPPYI